MKREILLLTFIYSFSNIFGQDATVIYKNTVNSTVTIETDIALGSGFFIGNNLIATNYHVVKGAKEVYCYTNSSSIKYKIDGYVAIDTTIDIILLKVRGINKPSIKPAANSISPGQKVYVIGSPFGLPATISDGIVSGLRELEKYKLIQITAPISEGSSGGPVLNSKGEVIGLSVAQLKDGQNLNFAIPILYVQNLEKNLIPLKQISELGDEIISVPPFLTKIDSSQTLFNIEQDGSFKILRIGNQKWMPENLNVSTFRNGDKIPEAKTDEEWLNAGKLGNPAWCYYKNDPANGAKYGKLYNWYAVNDPRNIIPIGWHVPTESEWKEFINYLGGEVEAGHKLKNINGFPRLNYVREGDVWTLDDDDGHRCVTVGIMAEFCGVPAWWSSSHHSSPRISTLMYWSNDRSFIFFAPEESGCYIRCIKD